MITKIETNSIHRLHRLHSAALAAKQTQLSALPLRSLRLCGVPWAVPNTQRTM
jgi:hypothetical protein